MATASRADRLGIVLRWPIGIALVSWRYMWRTTPLHRSEEVGSSADLPGPPDEDEGTAEGRQPLAAGVGPLLHRSYAVRIAGSARPAAPATSYAAATSSWCGCRGRGTARSG